MGCWNKGCFPYKHLNKLERKKKMLLHTRSCHIDCLEYSNQCALLLEVHIEMFDICMVISRKDDLKAYSSIQQQLLIFIKLIWNYFDYLSKNTAHYDFLLTSLLLSLNEFLLVPMSFSIVWNAPKNYGYEEVGSNCCWFHGKLASAGFFPSNQLLTWFLPLRHNNSSSCLPTDSWRNNPTVNRHCWDYFYVMDHLLYSFFSFFSVFIGNLSISFFMFIFHSIISRSRHFCILAFLFIILKNLQFCK